MKCLILDQAMVDRLTEFCDKDNLQNYIDLLGDVADYITDEGDDSGGEMKKKLKDWVISLHDMKQELKALRRAQQ